MKSVLFIADGFPPVAGAGVKRPLKFMKFLSATGWRCHVLTATNDRYLPLDPSLLAEVAQGTTVHRTYTLECLFKRRRNGEPPGANVPARGLRSFFDSANLTHTFYKLCGRFVAVPDSYVLWLPSAVRRGYQVCKKHEISVIVATGPSFTNFLIGALLRKLTGTPLLLDVRDAWVSDPSIRWRSNHLKKLNAKCEQFAVKWADRVISTNPFVTKDFIQRYPNKPLATFDTILNGFDRDDFDFCVAPRPASSKQFTIVHTGRLYAERTPKHFLQALGQALAKRPAMHHQARVIFVGSCETYLDGKRVEDYIREFGLGNVVELAGRVPRRRSLEYQLEADLLLLLIGIVPPAQALTYGISGKLFDYLLCRKPILTLANEGATRELIRSNELGDLFFHEDTDALADYLIRAFDRFVQGQPATPPAIASLAQFDFRSLSQRLAVHLEEISRH